MEHGRVPGVQWTAAGEPCEPGFSYDSGTNDAFLTVDELRQLIATELP